MKILIVSNVYHPVINPRAFRWTAIAELWASQGHDIDVLTSWRPGFLKFEEKNKVKIHRAGESVFQKMRIRLLNEAEKTSGTGDNSGTAQKKRLRRKMLSLIKHVSDYTWKKIHWPDCECVWYLPAVKKVRSLLQAHRYDAAISVSTPFTSHLVGLKVNSFHRGIPWLVDIGDPFSFHTVEHQNNYVLYNRLNFRIERKVFSSADCITVTSKGTQDKYVSHFPGYEAKINVIPPLISFPGDYQKNKKPFFEKNSKLRLLFVGNFYRPVRRPEFLLKVFGELLSTPLKDKLELHIVGSVKDVMDFFAPYEGLLRSGKIILHGVLEHKKALDAMTGADVLINLGNDTIYQLPSKIADYMATGKPIVNLASIRNDSSSLALEDYPLSVTVVDDGFSGDSPDFTKLVNFLKNMPNSLDESVIDRIIMPFKKETIAENYMSLLKEISTRV